MSDSGVCTFAVPPPYCPTAPPPPTAVPLVAAPGGGNRSTPQSPTLPEGRLSFLDAGTPPFVPAHYQQHPRHVGGAASSPAATARPTNTATAAASVASAAPPLVTILGVASFAEDDGAATAAAAAVAEMAAAAPLHLASSSLTDFTPYGSPFGSRRNLKGAAPRAVSPVTLSRQLASLRAAVASAPRRDPPQPHAAAGSEFTAPLSLLASDALTPRDSNDGSRLNVHRLQLAKPLAVAAPQSSGLTLSAAGSFSLAGLAGSGPVDGDKRSLFVPPEQKPLLPFGGTAAAPRSANCSVASAAPPSPPRPEPLLPPGAEFFDDAAHLDSDDECFGPDSVLFGGGVCGLATGSENASADLGDGLDATVAAA